MRRARLMDAFDGRLLVPNLEITETVWEATCGLLGRGSLAAERGLLIEHCRCIHTVLMRFPLDLVYLTKNREILRVVEGVRPWRFSACRNASSVLELASGQAVARGFRAGGRVRIELL